MHWSTAPIPYWKKKWVVSTKVNSTVKQMSNGSINAYTRQDVDRKYPSIWEKIQKWIVPLFQTTFHYDAHQWKNCDEFNLLGGETGFDEQESNLSTFWNTSFSKICLGMKINQQLKLIVIYKLTDSLHSLIADGQYRKTFLGRDGWKKLIGSNATTVTRKDSMPLVVEVIVLKSELVSLAMTKTTVNHATLWLGLVQEVLQKAPKSCGN